MATTSLSLGEHWEAFIKNEIASGRYGSASEVVRDALRAMEERKSKLEALRAHLAQGAKQAGNGDFVDDYGYQKCGFVPGMVQADWQWLEHFGTVGRGPICCGFLCFDQFRKFLFGGFIQAPASALRQ